MNMGDIAYHSSRREDSGNRKRHQRNSGEIWRWQATCTIYHPLSKVLNGCMQYVDTQ